MKNEKDISENINFSVRTDLAIEATELIMSEKEAEKK